VNRGNGKNRRETLYIKEFCLAGNGKEKARDERPGREPTRELKGSTNTGSLK
jgi:hypothetical protein